MVGAACPVGVGLQVQGIINGACAVEVEAFFVGWAIRQSGPLAGRDPDSCVAPKNQKLKVGKESSEFPMVLLGLMVVESPWKVLM